MDEIRDIILGIDFGRVTSQLCYFDRKKNEAQSVSMKVGTQEFEIPTLLCRRVDRREFAVGLEADYFAREQGGILLENLYELCRQEEEIEIGDTKVYPGDLLAVYLDYMLKFLGITDLNRKVLYLGITVESLDAPMVRNIRQAFRILGYREKQYRIMDYGESFYYLAMKKKSELWCRQAGWYHFEGNTVSFRKLSMNVTVKPVTVKLDPPVTRELNEREKDLSFYQFIQDTLRTEPFVHIYITGNGFSQDWAKKSCGTLAKNRRRVFIGNNMNVLGACEAGKEQLENLELEGFRYYGDSMVRMNLGMDLIIQGSRTYYPLVEAGSNWFECRKKLDVIVDDVEELTFFTSPMGEKTKSQMSIPLEELPKRPNRTTRLRISVNFINQETCRIQARDLGFGEMFPSEGKVWTEEIEWK